MLITQTHPPGFNSGAGASHWDTGTGRPGTAVMELPFLGKPFGLDSPGLAAAPALSPSAGPSGAG